MTPTNLQHELDQRGLGTYQAAPVLRLSRSYIWMLLHGQRNITAERAELIRLRLAEYDAR